MAKTSGALPFATDVHPPDALWPGAQQSGVPHAIITAIHTDRASVMARNRIRPITDVRASAAYGQQVAGNLLFRLLDHGPGSSD